MNKKDYSNLEDQIMYTVSNALKAIDVANLKKDINYKTEKTINEFKERFNEYGIKYMNLNKKSKNDISQYISKKPAGRVSGTICIVFGAVGTGIYGVSTLLLLISNIFVPGDILASQIIWSISGVTALFFAGSVVLLIKGMNIKKRVKRFKTYVRFMGNNTYFSIEDLAQLAKEKKSFILKDLNKMIDLGMFLQGHIDDEETYFMINDEVYGDYLRLKKEQIEKKANNKRVKEENTSTDEVDSIIEVGRKYIAQIKAIKNELYKEEIAVKLAKLENISNEILNQVEKNPKKAQEVNKFINHYLPITIKLINSYKELNSQMVQGDNVKVAKIEIEKSIDLIQSAFENLLDDLFEDVVLDISTDISVLKTLFKQEGLGDEDFKK